MKPWIKFIPLCLLVSYVIIYDVVDQYNHSQPASQQTVIEQTK
ncbi:hypothetical protein ACPV5O_09675 [Vibrio maritimus]|nr:hypothetical protein [Vibrio sp. SCSIO 43140]GAL30307.1 hypothetical protein JCM19239_5739 [Vibrio variabilis]